jgi:hypothetical protein
MREYMKSGVRAGGEKMNAMIQKVTDSGRETQGNFSAIGEEGAAVEEFQETGIFVGVWTADGTTGKPRAVTLCKQTRLSNADKAKDLGIGKPVNTST